MSVPPDSGLKTIADFNFDHQPGAKRETIAHLATRTYLTSASNIVLLGPPGTGHRQDPPRHWPKRQSSPARTPPPLRLSDPLGHPPGRRPPCRTTRRRAETTAPLPAADRRRNRPNPLRTRSSKPVLPTRPQPLRTRLRHPDIELAVRPMERRLRRPRRSPHPQRQQLPTQRRPVGHAKRENRAHDKLSHQHCGPIFTCRKRSTFQRSSTTVRFADTKAELSYRSVEQIADESCSYS